MFHISVIAPYATMVVYRILFGGKHYDINALDEKKQTKFRSECLTSQQFFLQSTHIT